MPVSPMVILIASDQSKIRRGLADRLREGSPHRILTAGTVAEMETVPEAEGALDLLLFSPVFSMAGKEARTRLRTRFPGVQTLALEDGLSLDQILALVQPWLPEETGVRPAKEDKVPAALGDYDIRDLLRGTERTLIYKAVQHSVQREVGLERLRPELAADPEAVREFRRMVRARAMVSHPAIAAVYEAQEVNDVIFYTRELVRGNNLVEWAASGNHFPQATLLQMLLTVGDAFEWMLEHGIAHDPVNPVAVYLGPNGTARVANIAQPGEPDAGPVDTMPALADICLRLAEPRGAPVRELSHLLGLMKTKGPHAVTTWKQLAREARAGLQRLTEANSPLLPESRDRALAKKRLLVRQIPLAGGVLLLGAGVWLGLNWWTQANRAKVRDVSDTITIPAGEFIFRDGQVRRLPEFNIDRYEVTLAEYNAFLEALPHGPANRFDHPDQPPAKKDHLPKDWPEVSAAARAAGAWKGHPITLNAPVFNVDWWDAWAYAKWKGRRLPSEEEWEKAARGPKGNLWPWGNDPDPKRANTGVDYTEKPNAGGKTDGHVWWSDVDAMPQDISAYGVSGMGGNVSEWTGTLVPDPDLPDVQVPVFRGADFHQTQPVPLKASPWLAKSALYAQPFLGFRTASLPSSP